MHIPYTPEERERFSCVSCSCFKIKGSASQLFCDILDIHRFDRHTFGMFHGHIRIPCFWCDRSIPGTLSETNQHKNNNELSLEDNRKINKWLMLSLTCSLMSCSCCCSFCTSSSWMLLTFVLVGLMGTMDGVAGTVLFIATPIPSLSMPMASSFSVFSSQAADTWNHFRRVVVVVIMNSMASRLLYLYCEYLKDYTYLWYDTLTTTAHR